jgi:hypothetical protein
MSQTNDTDYYKCVTIDLRSSNANYVQTSLKEFEKFLVIQYKIGEFVKPVIRGTQLFVFSNYYSAYEFQCEQEMSGKHVDVYICEVKNPKKNPPIYTYFRDAIEVLKQKKNKKKLPSTPDYSSFRENSIGCSEVKLLKKINVKEYTCS